MMAAVHDHDALRYWDIMHVITYHPDAPTFIAHQIFMVNGKDTVRGHVSLIDAEVVKFHQCISKCNIDFLIEKLSDIGARRIDHCWTSMPKEHSTQMQSWKRTSLYQ